MKPIGYTLMLTICLFGITTAQDKFELPTKLDMLPVTYLKTLKVADANKQLSHNEKASLCRLFSQAYLVTMKKYNQDYLLNTDAPIYRLFKKNFPRIEEKEGEGGVFLGNIYKFIKSLPEFKSTEKATGAKIR